jgi:hypothetical protein
MNEGPGEPATVSIVVVHGHDAGLAVVLRPGHCMMVGRSPLHGKQASRSTGMLPAQSQQRLQVEDIAAVERHLQSRNARHVHAEARFASFERDVDLALADDAVSACHAMLFVDDDGASLLDLGSTNGTFVNGTATTSGVLASGDLVRIGETRLSVRVGDGP